MLGRANETWSVWKAYYMTYEEIAEQGDKPRELVKRGLSFDDAQKMAKALGFGYYTPPES